MIRYHRIIVKVQHDVVTCDEFFKVQMFEPPYQITLTVMNNEYNTDDIISEISNQLIDHYKSLDNENIL